MALHNGIRPLGRWILWTLDQRSKTGSPENSEEGLLVIWRVFNSWEIKGVLNNCPLIYVGDNVEEILSPSQFFILQQLTREGTGIDENLSVDAPAINHARKMLNRFLDAWYPCYLLSLWLRPHEAISTQQIHVHLRLRAFQNCTSCLHDASWRFWWSYVCIPLSFILFRPITCELRASRCVKIKHGESLKRCVQLGAIRSHLKMHAMVARRLHRVDALGSMRTSA